jgi:hypothetical protein
MRLIPLRFWIAGLLISSGNLGPAAADQPDTVKVVTPEALGVLTKCRGWLVTRSCRTYHHIRLPSRIAVGDTITVLFGSHPKEYRFSVARIALEDAIARQPRPCLRGADSTSYRARRHSFGPSRVSAGE